MRGRRVKVAGTPFALAASLVLAPIVALAQSTAQPSQAPATEPNAALSPVVVTATRTERNPLDVPASVDVITGEQLRDAQLRVNLSETLNVLPGVVVLNRQNYAQDLQISMRGFGARSTFGVRGVRMYVDGVPASFPDGQGQVSHFPLNLAERIEVLRGPFSALYGNSSGGVIALTTQLKPQEPRFELSTAGGSNGTWRAGFTGMGGQDSNAFVVDAQRFHTDGERDHSAATRDTLNLRLGFGDTPLGKLRLSFNSLAMPDSQDPLGLTRAELEADPEQASPQALLFNTRKTTRQNTAGANLESTLATGWTLSSSAWLGTRSVMQYQAIPTTTQIPASSPGGVIDFDRRFGGVDLRSTYEHGPLSATVGFDVQRMNEDRRGFQNYVGPAATPTERGVLGPLRRDESNEVQSADPYLQLEWRASDRWRLHAGARSSRVTVTSSDRFLSNGDDSGKVSFKAVNPSVGANFRASADTSYYVAYGRGFETPTLNELAYRPDGSAGINTNLRASRSNNVEAGFKLERERIAYTLAAYRITTNDEIVVIRNQGGRSAFGNATQTQRDGLEASALWRAQRWTLYSSLGLINARYTAPFSVCRTPPCTVPNENIAADNKLPGVPARTFAVEAKYRASWAILGAQLRSQSALFVNDTNSDRAAGFTTLNLSAARTFDLAGHPTRVFARIDNATDRRYVGSVIVNEGNQRFFEPAPGRTWLVGLDYPL